MCTHTRSPLCFIRLAMVMYYEFDPACLLNQKFLNYERPRLLKVDNARIFMLTVSGDITPETLAYLPWLMSPWRVRTLQDMPECVDELMECQWHDLMVTTDNWRPFPCPGALVRLATVCLFDEFFQKGLTQDDKDKSDGEATNLIIATIAAAGA